MPLTSSWKSAFTVEIWPRASEYNRDEIRRKITVATMTIGNDVSATNARRGAVTSNMMLTPIKVAPDTMAWAKPSWRNFDKESISVVMRVMIRPD